MKAPPGTIDRDYSDPQAEALTWEEATRVLREAPVYWISTVRPDGRPHVTPLVGVWHAGAMYFATGAEERKANNIAENPYCTFTTGCNTFTEGLDVVLEGEAVRVRDARLLEELAGAFTAKYSDFFGFQAMADGFSHHQGGEGGEALVFKVAPAKAFAFARGPFGQTRWRFKTEGGK